MKGAKNSLVKWKYIEKETINDKEEINGVTKLSQSRHHQS